MFIEGFRKWLVKIHAVYAYFTWFIRKSYASLDDSFGGHNYANFGFPIPYVKVCFPDYPHVQLYHRVSLLYQYMARSPRTWKVGRSNPGRCRLRSLKQVVRAPLPNARQQD